ncbi:LSD1 zinc finger domain containing protein [Musa troglodytarum]|uniref:LSD1 zinc finger domain containing protein n=1 Tax=Musa troglodytarum TaxID=320322 RepID=A0A9E7L2W5_9LILI|nr:LSD1 zinc finger domain containing protein [Musa troglodytarum]
MDRIGSTRPNENQNCSLSSSFRLDQRIQFSYAESTCLQRLQEHSSLPEGSHRRALCNMQHNNCSCLSRNGDGSAHVSRLSNIVDVLLWCYKRKVAYVNCGQCRTRLMYPYGAPSVKCSICQSITNVGMPNTRVPVPAAHRPNEIAPVLPSTSVHSSRPSNMTVVVENPMSVNESGKLVSNVVVGVNKGKK